MMRLTIDKIPVEMFRTVHKKDALGNRIRDKEKYIGYKKVKCVETGPRVGHFIIDLVCFQLIYYTFTTLLNIVFLAAPQNAATVLSLALVSLYMGLLLYPLFYFLFEFFLQKTPGKFVTKTIVVNEYGEKPDVSAMILRTMVRLVPFEAFSCFSDTNRGWHDRWSKTYVLPLKEYEEIRQLMEKQAGNNSFA